MNDISSILKKILPTVGPLSKAKVVGTTHLRGDASSRRYYRVAFEDAEIKSAILMLLQPTPGPVVSYKNGVAPINQDEGFVRAGEWLAAKQWPVVKFYTNNWESGAILVEDIGDLALYRVATNQLNDMEFQTIAALGVDPTLAVFKLAIDELLQLQKLPQEESFIGSCRCASHEVLLQELAVFFDIYLTKRGAKPSVHELFTKYLHSLCEFIRSHKHVLSHRDYMPWNLHLSLNHALQLQLRIIDFQDIFIASYTRDLAALLNDRDMDQALGLHRQQILLECFAASAGIDQKTLEKDYYESLLHRDLRVGAQFVSLDQKKGGNTQYADWIPGTMRRLHTTVVATYSRYDSGCDVAAEIEHIVKAIPGVY